jgi:hypothetical protein
MKRKNYLEDFIQRNIENMKEKLKLITVNGFLQATKKPQIDNDEDTGNDAGVNYFH